MMDGAECPGHEKRTLSDKEYKKLSLDTVLVSEYKQHKLKIETKKSWDLFYKRNKTNFYKDRHWTTREFKELTETKVSYYL